MCFAGIRSPGTEQYSDIRLLTLVELSLAGICANAPDSASFPIPGVAESQEKICLDTSIEEELSSLLVKAGEVTIWK